MAASAAFEVDPGTATYADPPADVSSSGATVTLRIKSLTDVQPSRISWSVVGTHGVSSPTLTLGGSPLGQTATFTVPAGEGQAYGIKLEVNGGQDVAGGATATGGVYVLNNAGVRPGFIGETFERDSSYGIVPTLNDQLVVNGDGLIVPPSYTVSELGALSSPPAGALAWCTDETGGARLAVYNGSAWKRVDDATTTIS